MIKHIFSLFAVLSIIISSSIKISNAENSKEIIHNEISTNPLKPQTLIPNTYLTENSIINKEFQPRISEREKLLLLVTILTLVAACIIIWVQYQSKTKASNKTIQLEKERTKFYKSYLLKESELITTQQALENTIKNLQENDNIINQLKQELKIKSENKGEKVESLHTLLQEHIVTEERWLKFKTEFDKVYPGYLHQMKVNFEKISDNDLKLIALQKLDINNTKMSNLLCISIEGVKKAKQRLKKKLDNPIIEREPTY